MARRDPLAAKHHEIKALVHAAEYMQTAAGELQAAASQGRANGTAKSATSMRTAAADDMLANAQRFYDEALLIAGEHADLADVWVERIADARL